MPETHWVNKHQFQPSRDFPEYCRCGAHRAHPEHEATAQVEKARSDIRYLQMQTARRCAEIAMERCRLLNGDAMAMRRAGREEMAAAAEMKAEQFVWMAGAIRREFDLPDEG